MRISGRDGAGLHLSLLRGQSPAAVRAAPDRRVADLARLQRLLRAELGDAAFDESYLDGRATTLAGRLPELL